MRAQEVPPQRHLVQAGEGRDGGGERGEPGTGGAGAGAATSRQGLRDRRGGESLRASREYEVRGRGAGRHGRLLRQLGGLFLSRLGDRRLLLVVSIVVAVPVGGGGGLVGGVRLARGPAARNSAIQVSPPSRRRRRAKGAEGIKGKRYCPQERNAQTRHCSRLRRSQCWKRI